jgi:hypothetical protein
VKTVFFACSDGRLHDPLFALETRLDATGADRLLVPGGPQTLLVTGSESTPVMRWLEVLVRGHGLERVCLVAHEDCLAYGDRVAARAGSARALAEDDLARAATIVGRQLPQTGIERYVIPWEEAAGRFGSAERVG